MPFLLIRVYAHIYFIIKNLFNINIRGLGFMLRQIKSNKTITVKNKRLFLDCRLAEAYSMNIINRWNEPETHRFISLVLDKTPSIFIEVGANIGEFVIDIGSHSGCISTIAFEPNPIAFEAVDKSLQLNRITNCLLVNKALSSYSGSAQMVFDSHSPTASLKTYNNQKTISQTVILSTLDQEITLHNLENYPNKYIVLIDVEGHELEVIRGSKKFFRGNSPLIIFEYHNETRKSFSLSELQLELGEQYEIFRLRQDSKLDKELSTTWNCVALNRTSSYYKLIQDAKMICS